MTIVPRYGRANVHTRRSVPSLSSTPFNASLSPGIIEWGRIRMTTTLRAEVRRSRCLLGAPIAHTLELMRPLALTVVSLAVLASCSAGTERSTRCRTRRHQRHRPGRRDHAGRHRRAGTARLLHRVDRGVRPVGRGSADRAGRLRRSAGRHDRAVRRPSPSDGRAVRGSDARQPRWPRRRRCDAGARRHGLVRIRRSPTTST